MPRPCKKRCVGSLPKAREFGPIDTASNDYISMSVEEYEVIKLIDFDKLTQAEAAEKLDVSRSTVQAIYQKARENIARALIEVKTIHIDGGNYKLRNKGICKKGKRCCKNENSSSK